MIIQTSQGLILIYIFIFIFLLQDTVAQLEL